MSPHVSAHVAVNGRAKPEYRSILARRDFQPAAIFPRMIRRHQMLAAIFDPFNRLSQIYRGERNQKIFRIKLAADAEAAADIVFNEVQFTLGHFKKICDGLPVEMGQLGYAPNRQLSFASVESGDQPPGFHGIAGEAMHAKLLPPGVFGLLKRAIHVANGKFMDGGEIRSGSLREARLDL